MLSAFVWLAAVPVVLVFVIYTAEVVIGLRAERADGPLPPGFPHTAILIPAHNEAGGIAKTLAALSQSIAGATEVLVIADNCTDDTAARARASGATVVERNDPDRRGKGYALAFGRDALAAAPPECVIVLDADCTMSSEDLARLARVCVDTGRPVQSCNLLRPNLSASAVEQISNFAFLVKNLVRQRGMVRVGGVAALTGTGMALPWARFHDAPLATADIVEDLALGIWLTRRGSPPLFLAGAETWSDPAAATDLLVQRSRWERGFLATARRHALPLVGEGLARRSVPTFWLGLHLLVPPLALLFLCGAAGLTAAATAALFGGTSWLPFALLALSSGCGAAATILAWHGPGRATISGRTLLRVPLYVAAKLPIYLRLFTRDRAGWTRTRRPDE